MIKADCCLIYCSKQMKKKTNETIQKGKIDKNGQVPYSHAYNPQCFCSDCGVQNLVRILYNNTKFQIFFFKKMSVAKTHDNT